QFPGRLVALEMGGNNPLVVSFSSNRPASVYLILLSAFLTSGQRCSAARRLILIDDQLLEPLVKAAKTLRVGAFTEKPEPFMGPVVSEAACDKLVNAYDKLLSRGGRALLPLVRTDKCFLSPAIIDMTGCSMIDTEHFGPILQVVRVDTMDE